MAGTNTLEQMLDPHVTSDYLALLLLVFGNLGA